MRLLYNPYADYDNYNCFGCAPENPVGLKLYFYEDGKYILTSWDPSENMEGFFNVLHGGIQATLLDEISSWVVFVKVGSAGVTSRLDIKYKQPVNIDGGKITIRGKLVKLQRNIAVIYAEILDKNGKLCAFADVQYFTFTEEKARQILYYPGKNKFYPGS